MNVKTIACLFACALLSACSYKLTLQQRGGPGVGSGVATENDKGVQITIGTRVFTGQYAYASDASFGSFVGVGKGRTSTGFVSTSSGGGGNIIARSADGIGLRCQFQFSEMSGQGFGECADDTGATYDLQIRMGG
ncbi:hypothetical protein [Acidovorax sp. BL-A-41-H1]|uniref:hypothetical protein n=1 Tax=Acidovorax sp. BL-A-41-H1 TaxID=3421102 RepID=UPI003F7B3361